MVEENIVKMGTTLAKCQLFHAYTHDIKSQVIKKSSEIISTQMAYSEGENRDNQSREWERICELYIWQRVSVQNTQGIPIAL